MSDDAQLSAAKPRGFFRHAILWPMVSADTNAR